MDSKELWEYTAMDALWRRADSLSLPLGTGQWEGLAFKVRIKNHRLKSGEHVLVEYLPVNAYFNGFDTSNDLDGFRLCRGVLSEVGTSVGVQDNLYGDKAQDATLTVTATFPLNYFETHCTSRLANADWGNEFLNGVYFVNFRKVGEYYLLSGSSQGYAGEEYVLIRTAKGFDALYCKQYFEGDPTWVGGGRVELPDRIADRLRRKISVLNNQSQHWAGEKI